ncbi:MAG: DUF2059 domain-containing protein [Candidatus Omnitrophica bacterium]|nr:DUF2059 domain-containing protein [Candidatus Omnitrophota bacterium]
MKLIKLFLVMLLCGQASLVSAQGHNVDELIVKSGIQRQVEQLPDVMKAQFEDSFRQDRTMSAADRYNLRTAASESFDPAEMLKTVKERMAGTFTDQDISEILTWLNSPLGMRITELEEKASSASAYREMVEFAQNMTEPQPQRLALVQRLDAVAELTNYATQIKIDMALAMTQAMACVSGCDNFSRDEMVGKLESVRSQIQEGSRQEVLVNSLYSYQSLADEELEEYVRFYETTAGQKYMKVVKPALSQSIQNASKMMGEKLGAALKEKKAMAEPKQ